MTIRSKTRMIVSIYFIWDTDAMITKSNKTYGIQNQVIQESDSRGTTGISCFDVFTRKGREAASPAISCPLQAILSMVSGCQFITAS